MESIRGSARAAFGDDKSARDDAVAAIALSPGSPDAEALWAVGCARASDAARARTLAGDLGKKYPVSTLIQTAWVPTIDAQLELNRGGGARAIELLQPSSRVELGQTIGSLNNSCMIQVYLRGEAYLQTKQGAQAAAEFQKLLDHRGIVWNCWSGALAHLGLARAYGVFRAAPSKPVPPTRTSSRCGKRPTPTSPSCSKPRPSTRSCGEGRDCTASLRAESRETIKQNRRYF